MERLQAYVDRAFQAFARQTDVRRAAIIGVGFGLLLCVVATLIILTLAVVSQLGGAA